ncbi:MAG TPA: hypothetical protein VK449_06990 [Anaerolineales bacterium]|nr:hypothetical protein [Anaerolineales bacterium]
MRQPAPSAGRQEQLPVSPTVGCVVSVLIGLMGSLAFFFVLWFNRQGQIVYGAEPFRTTRVWLLRGAEGRGLGISKTRPLPGATEDQVCARTEVSFYFIGGAVAGADTDYCECYARSDAGWSLAGGCPE